MLYWKNCVSTGIYILCIQPKVTFLSTYSWQLATVMFLQSCAQCGKDLENKHHLKRIMMGPDYKHKNKVFIFLSFQSLCSLECYKIVISVKVCDDYYYWCLTCVITCIKPAQIITTVLCMTTTNQIADSNEQMFRNWNKVSGHLRLATLVFLLDSKLNVNNKNWVHFVLKWVFPKSKTWLIVRYM